MRQDEPVIECCKVIHSIQPPNISNVYDVGQCHGPDHVKRKPARFSWHEVRRIAHYYLSVDAMTQPMRLREDSAEYRGETMERKGIVDQKTLDEIIRRIVEVAEPKKIILFGSAATGQIGPDSDLDLLVIMPDGVHRRRTAQAIYSSLKGFGLSKDIVVATEDDVRNYGDNPSLVLCPALREGRELYRAPG
jgi:predicted nucleotidyltransferase